MYYLTSYLSLHAERQKDRETETKTMFGRFKPPADPVPSDPPAPSSVACPRAAPCSENSGHCTRNREQRLLKTGGRSVVRFVQVRATSWSLHTFSCA